MDRSNFLKKLMAGAAMPVMLAGCSAEDNADTGILEPGEDAAAKSAGYYMFDKEDCELWIEFGHMIYYFTERKYFNDRCLYVGYYEVDNRCYGATLVYDKVSKGIVLTDCLGREIVTTFALKHYGKKQLCGHGVVADFTHLENDDYLVEYGKITKGALPGLTD